MTLNDPQLLNATSDADLIEAVRNNDSAAFTAIYERYHRLIYAVAFRFIKDRAVAENTVQYVFTRLWEYREEVAIANNLRNYLFTMAKNQMLNYIRNQNLAVVKNYELAQTAENYDDNLIETLDRNHRTELLDAAIDQLPEQKREVCRLKREGCSNQEIADQLHISVNTVKTHYAQSIKIMRAYVLKIYVFSPAFLILFY